MGPHIDVRSDSLRALVSISSSSSLKPHYKSLFSKTTTARHTHKKKFKSNDIEDSRIINTFEDSIIRLTGATLHENPIETFLDGTSFNIDLHDTLSTSCNMSSFNSFMKLDVDSFLKSAIKMEKESYLNNKAQ